MLHDENKKPLFLLFIGEIFAGVASLSLLSTVLNFFGYVSILGVIGFVITLIGVIRLRNSCSAFKSVFYGTIAAITLYLVAAILTAVGTNVALSEDGAKWMLFIISLVVLFAKVVQFYMILKTVEGATIITKSEENERVGKLAIKLFLIGLGIIVVCILLTGIFEFALTSGQLSGIFLQIFAIFASVLGVASEILYIIFLFKSYQELE